MGPLMGKVRPQHPGDANTNAGEHTSAPIPGQETAGGQTKKPNSKKKVQREDNTKMGQNKRRTIPHCRRPIQLLRDNNT